MLADLDLLLTFRQIVEQGSFKRAADRLNRTQSAISMQMKRLEDHMGHQLMTRSSQGLNLTATGQGGSALCRATGPAATGPDR